MWQRKEKDFIFFEHAESRGIVIEIIDIEKVSFSMKTGKCK